MHVQLFSQRFEKVFFFFFKVIKKQKGRKLPNTHLGKSKFILNFYDSIWFPSLSLSLLFLNDTRKMRLLNRIGQRKQGSLKHIYTYPLNTLTLLSHRKNYGHDQSMNYEHEVGHPKINISIKPRSVSVPAFVIRFFSLYSLCRGRTNWQPFFCFRRSFSFFCV